MNLLKETAIETIRRLPDECTIDEIMYRLGFIAQVLDGLRDAEAGKTMTTGELLKKVDRWAQ